MSERDLVDKIFSEANKYTAQERGSYFTLKDKRYKPWEPWAGAEGRYNGPGTGSLYLGDSIETCAKEVGVEDRIAYSIDLGSLKPARILDLRAWSVDNPASSGSLLIESSSGGWELTRGIADRAYAEGFDGIRFISQHGNERTNLLLYRDRVGIEEGLFTEIGAVESRTDEVELEGETLSRNAPDDA